MLKKYILVFIASIIFLASFSTTIAVAGHPTTYSGSNCKPLTNTAAVYYGTGSISNLSSSSTMRVNCGTAFDIQGRIEGAWVRVQDLHTIKNIQCCLVNTILNSVGGQNTSVRCVNSTGFHRGVQHLNFPAMNTMGVHSNTYMVCTLPVRSGFFGNSSIRSYNVNP